MKYQLHLYSGHKIQNLKDLIDWSNQVDECYYLNILAAEMVQDRSDIELYSYDLQSQSVVSVNVKGNIHDIGHIYHDLILLKNIHTGLFSLLDFKDGPTSAQYFQNSPGFAGALIAMYDQDWVDQNFNFPELIEPYLFFDQQPNLTQKMQIEISELHQDADDDRLFMAATLGDENYYNIRVSDGRYFGRRHIARVLQEKYPSEVLILDRDQKMPRPEFWRKAARHRWNLFLPGHPWCYREHELWKLGLPTISLNLWHPLMISLNPGRHYISVQVPAQEREHTGCSLNPESHADHLMSVFRRVRNNEKLRKRIALSAQHRMKLADVRSVASQTLHRLIELTQ